MAEREHRADFLRDEAQARDIEARDLELGTFDVDSFTDFLFGDCDGCSPVQLRETISDVTAADFVDEPPSEVLAVACDAGQPIKTRIAALDALIEANGKLRALQREQARQRAQALAVVKQWTREAA